jgi:hypothetical protein
LIRSMLFYSAIVSGITLVLAVAWPAVYNARALLRLRARPRYSKSKALLAEREQAIFQSLRNMVSPALDVFPNVRLYDLLDLVGGNEDRDQELARRIRATSVDFVLCDAVTSRPMFVVALPHGSADDPKARTEERFLTSILEAAGLPLLPFASPSEPSSPLDETETFQKTLATYLRAASHAA